jgi:hypothetical protein
MLSLICIHVKIVYFTVNYCVVLLLGVVSLMAGSTTSVPMSPVCGFQTTTTKEYYTSTTPYYTTTTYATPYYTEAPKYYTTKASKYYTTLPRDTTPKPQSITLP